MTHPVLQGMLMTGCLKQQNILLAFHTYMELCEVKLLWEVDYSYEKELDIIYLKAKSNKNAENFDYYLPISSSSTITPNWIKNVQSKIGEFHNSSFVLVIKDKDSSSVYYNVSSGLIPPLSPESSKRKKCLEEKRKFMWTELKKKQSQLFLEAKKSLTSENNSPSASNTVTSDSTIPHEVVDDDDDDDIVIQDVNVNSSCKSSQNNKLNISDSSSEQIEVIELF